MNYTIVYNVAEEATRTDYRILGILLCFFFFYIIRRPIEEKKRRIKIGGSIVFLLAIGFESKNIINSIRKFDEVHRILEDEHYKIVEGKIKNFKPMPFTYTKDRYERFTVNDIKFRYADHDNKEYGYNQTQAYGGTLKNDEQVRITYILKENRNIIYKLEIAN